MFSNGDVCLHFVSNISLVFRQRIHNNFSNTFTQESRVLLTLDLSIYLDLCRVIAVFVEQSSMMTDTSVYWCVELVTLCFVFKWFNCLSYSFSLYSVNCWYNRKFLLNYVQIYHRITAESRGFPAESPRNRQNSPRNPAEFLANLPRNFRFWTAESQNAC